MVCLSVICYVTELHAYDFVIKDFVIKKGVLFVPDPLHHYGLEPSLMNHVAIVEVPLVCGFLDLLSLTRVMMEVDLFRNILIVSRI